MSDEVPDSLRVLALVQRLNDKFGAQELGQIMQTLLALSFRRAGFQVLKNAVGVPDLQVFRRDRSSGFALEVKTGASSITLSRRDLEGVTSAGRIPAVAAFFLAEPTPRWWLVDATALKPVSYRRYEFTSKPQVDVGFDVTEQFSRVLAESFTTAIEGPAPLARVLLS